MSILGKSTSDNVYHMRSFPYAGNPETEIKITIVGESSVGKSSLSQRIAHDKFTMDTESTIGAAFFSFRCTHEEKNYVFKLWDTAGQERFDALVPMYLKGSHIVLLTFDVTNLHSFDKVKDKWYQRVIDRVPDAKILLLGNKTDMKEKRQVNKNLINSFIEKLNLKYIECSAKDGTGMDEMAKVFLDIAISLSPKSDVIIKLEEKTGQKSGCFDGIRCYPF